MINNQLKYKIDEYTLDIKSYYLSNIFISLQKNYIGQVSYMSNTHKKLYFHKYKKPQRSNFALDPISSGVRASIL